MTARLRCNSGFGGYKPISSIVSIARNGQVVLKHGNSGVQTIPACQVKKGSTVTVTLGFAVGPADRSKLDRVLIGEHRAWPS